MDDIWYYEDHGRAQGPVSTRELLSKIQKGDLQLLDLIFKEGEGEWHPVEHFTELTHLLGSISIEAKADWILLRNSEVDGKVRFEQLGPFTVEQVLELVDKGKATFKDHVWRTGFENWVPLGKVDKFEKPLASSVEVDLSLYKMPRHEILEDAPAAPVKTLKSVKKSPLKEEEPPAEAEGPDLARPAWEVVAKKAPQPEEPLTKTGSVIIKKVVAAAPIPAQAPAPIPVTENKISTPEIVPLVAKVSTKEENKKSEKKKTESQKEISLKLDVSRVGFEERRAQKIKVKEERRVDPPSAETVEKMRKRWHVVGRIVSAGSVALGVLLCVMWGYRSFFGTPEVEKISAPEIVQVLPPPAESEPEVAQQAPRPAPRMANPVVASPVAKPPPVAPVVAKETQTDVEVPSTIGNLAQMDGKQKSTFHHEERKFIFYTSQKALNIATELPLIYKRKGKSLAQWKPAYAAWQASLRKISAGELARNQQHLYPDLYQRLRKAVVSLDARAKEFNSQLVNGRNPTKELTVGDIVTELRRIHQKAKALDD